MISMKDERERARQSRERKRREKERRESEQLAGLVRIIIDKHKDQVDISPAWVALETMKRLKALDLRQDMPLVYVGCNLYVRQIAREICRKYFEDDDSPSIDPSRSTQHEMFPGLQKRYPIAKPTGEEPVYRLLENLSADDRLYNVERLRNEAKTKMTHADALMAYHELRLREERERATANGTAA